MLTTDKFSSQQDLYNCNIALRVLEKGCIVCLLHAAVMWGGLAFPMYIVIIFI